MSSVKSNINYSFGFNLFHCPKANFYVIYSSKGSGEALHNSGRVVIEYWVGWWDFEFFRFFFFRNIKNQKKLTILKCIILMMFSKLFWIENYQVHEFVCHGFQFCWISKYSFLTDFEKKISRKKFGNVTDQFTYPRQENTNNTNSVMLQKKSESH